MVPWSNNHQREITLGSIYGKKQVPLLCPGRKSGSRARSLYICYYQRISAIPARPTSVIGQNRLQTYRSWNGCRYRSPIAILTAAISSSACSTTRPSSSCFPQIIHNTGCRRHGISCIKAQPCCRCTHGQCTIAVNKNLF